MQSQILQRYPDANLRVYVVWLPVMPLDDRFDVADLLVDRRTIHYWDNNQRISQALADAYGSPGQLSGMRSSCSAPMHVGTTALPTRWKLAGRSSNTCRH